MEGLENILSKTFKVHQLAAKGNPVMACGDF